MQLPGTIACISLLERSFFYHGFKFTCSARLLTFGEKVALLGYSSRVRKLLYQYTPVHVPSRHETSCLVLTGKVEKVIEVVVVVVFEICMVVGPGEDLSSSFLSRTLRMLKAAARIHIFPHPLIQVLFVPSSFSFLRLRLRTASTSASCSAGRLPGGWALSLCFGLPGLGLGYMARILGELGPGLHS